MKIAYDDKLRLNNRNKARLSEINQILEDYRRQGYRLTLRQLYYQLVSKNIIPNEDGEYKKLSNILKKGRLAGIVDWDSIEDRIRKPMLPYYVGGTQEAIDDTIKQYRLDRMEGQEQRIEVWVEKDALSNVLGRVTRKYHVRLMVNRGYSSITAMHDAAERLNSADVILYFGDHDPSGLDMLRDIEKRLQMFGVYPDIIPVALTMPQIKKFNPPPNPAKIKDPRYEWYLERFGPTSWELDALPPEELNRLVEKAITSRIDLSLYNDMLNREKEDIKTLKSYYDEEE